MRISFNVEEIKQICEMAKQYNRKVMLVKDEGVYIMGQFFKSDNIENKVISYTKGCNPKKDSTCEDKSFKLSSSDFINYPPITQWLDELLTHNPNAKTFTLNVTPKTMSLVF